MEEKREGEEEGYREKIAKKKKERERRTVLTGLTKGKRVNKP